MSFKIIFDSDVLLHLSQIQLFDKVMEEYKKEYTLAVPIQVKKEILRWQKKKPGKQDFRRKDSLYIINKIDAMFEVLTMDNDLEAQLIYTQLINGEYKNDKFDITHKLGKGEAACIALSYSSSDIIGSSNFNDIGKFVDESLIIVKPTLQIIKEMTDRGVISLEESKKMVSILEEKQGSSITVKLFEEKYL